MKERLQSYKQAIAQNSIPVSTLVLVFYLICLTEVFSLLGGRAVRQVGVFV